MEREYQDYLDWLNAGGLEGTGQGAPGDSGSVPIAPPPPAPDPRNAPGPNQWGIPSESPNAPGYDRDLTYWLQNGVTPTGNPDSIFDVNGQVNPGWQRTPRGYERVPGRTTPPPETWPTGGGGNPTPTFTGGFTWGGAWPSYNAPGYLDPGPFDPGPAFTYKDFVKPDPKSVLDDPGFQFRIDQGRKALEASAAGKGTLRSGGTLKDILGYGQNFASQEYGNVYNRALQEYDTNRNNAADIWGKQYGQRRDVYDALAGNYGQHNTFNLSNAQADFSGRQRQAELEFQDAFNRWSKQGDWLSQYD